MENFFDLEESWQAVLQEELTKPYIQDLVNFVAKERQVGPKPVYPPQELVFNAFKLTPFSSVKVVLIGQDPYHGPGQAQGLSFSVGEKVPLPPSLKNIYQELENDLKESAPSTGSLAAWAKQGVLMLNATLTVRRGEPMSHHKQGWEKFTDAVVEKLIENPDPLVFILWGKSAQEKCLRLNSTPHHLVIKSAHPSPYSAARGFFGSHPFSQTNAFLLKQHKTPIKWV